MEPAALRAFVDEVEKIAAGPKFIHDPTVLTQAGLLGKYVTPGVAHSDDANAAVLRRAAGGVKPGQGIIALAPKETLRSAIAKPERADALYNMTRRHEMTHWLRDQRGKMKGVGGPGLLNVGRTVREEAAAYMSGLKAKGVKELPLKDRVRGVIAGTKGSVKDAYPRGVLRAIFHH